MHRLLLFALAGALAFSALSGLSRKRADGLVAPVSVVVAATQEGTHEAPEAGVWNPTEQDRPGKSDTAEQLRAAVDKPEPELSSGAAPSRAAAAPHSWLAGGAHIASVVSEVESYDSFDPLRFVLPLVTNRALSSSGESAWNEGRQHPGDVVWLAADSAREPGPEQPDESLNEVEREWIERELMRAFTSAGPEVVEPGVLLVRPLDAREARALMSQTEGGNGSRGASFEVTWVSLGFFQWSARITLRILPMSQASRAALRTAESR